MGKKRERNKGGGPIERVVAGGVPTLLHEQKANELIDYTNALCNMVCEPPDFGQFVINSGRAIFWVKGGGGNITAIMVIDSVPKYVTFTGVIGDTATYEA